MSARPQKKEKNKFMDKELCKTKSEETLTNFVSLHQEYQN